MLEAQVAPPVFTHADTLRGSNTPQRAWWDASFYDLHVKVNPADSGIVGYNAITYRVLRPAPAREMQIDLQLPLVVDSIVQDGLELSARRDGNAFFVTLISPQRTGTKKTISIYYHGKPTVAIRPPWDGGFVWALDSLSRNWVVTANEGLGASVWWPNKDIYSDEPDSQRVAITVPDSLLDVSNGRLRNTTPHTNWFGPFPWYEDGYKLVETPHLGMEHQSAVAYGNHYKNGYLGRDRSQTGHGLLWDFIIVHESAHEWFGNSITMKDAADMWIHESFATYAEGLFTECQQGKQAGAEYTIGQRKLIRNDVPIIGAYGVNHEGSGDMYDKGANMLLTIRQLVDDDARWRGILRGLGKTFWHQTVTTKQIENYISRQSGMDLSKVFDEYLRTTRIPTLEYKLEGQKLSYRWTDVVPGFAMPVKVTTSTGSYSWVRPTEKWKTMAVKLSRPEDFRVDENFYVNAKDLLKPAPDSTTVRTSL